MQTFRLKEEVAPVPQTRDAPGTAGGMFVSQIGYR